MSHPALRPLLVLACLPSVLFAVAPAPDPWTEARDFEFTAAAEKFARLHAGAPADARIAVAHAAGLLARQPRTAGNIADARAVLERVVATAGSAPGATAVNDPHVLAAYLLARIDHEHLDTPRPEAARAAYETLRRDHPGHPLADHAAVHLGFLLVEADPSAASAAIAPLEALLATVGLPAARRELHLLIGHLLIRRLDDPAAALPHYQAARRIGSEMPGRDPDLDLAIATLAGRTGDHALSAAHYLAFADARPRDTRAHTARRLAAEAAAKTARP